MKRRIELLIDDLDGNEAGPNGESITFELDGVAYAIDLSALHASKLRAAMAPYCDAGQRLSRTPVPHPRSASTTTVRQENEARKKERAEVAAWVLREKGITVADRGRLKQSYYDEYQEWKRNQTLAALVATKQATVKQATAKNAPASAPGQRRALKSVPAPQFSEAAPPAATRRRRSAS